MKRERFVYTKPVPLLSPLRHTKGIRDGAEEYLCHTVRSLASYSLGERSRRTLLSSAAQKGYDALVKLLLDMGQVDVNVPSATWLTETHMITKTPLVLASREGHESVVRRLLEVDGIDVSMGNPLL